MGPGDLLQIVSKIVILALERGEGGECGRVNLGQKSILQVHVKCFRVM